MIVSAATNIIVKVNNQPVLNTQDLAYQVGVLQVDRRAKFKVLRDKKYLDLWVSMSLREENINPSNIDKSSVDPASTTKFDNLLLGMELKQQDAAVVVNTIVDRSLSFTTGQYELAPMDQIVQADFVDVTTINQLKQQVEASIRANKKTMLLKVKRNNAEFYRVLNIG